MLLGLGQTLTSLALLLRALYLSEAPGYHPEKGIIATMTTTMTTTTMIMIMMMREKKVVQKEKEKKRKENSLT